MIDPHDASIDALISWLGTRRRRDPATPLSDLLADQPLDQNRLIDIACIDLMQRRRMDHAVRVEDYIAEFPCLSSDSHLLDLIDAELCIATELGEQVDIGQYTHRFPAFADQVRQLFQLELGDEANMTSALIDNSGPVGADQTGGGDASFSCAEGCSLANDFSIDVLPDDSGPERQVSALVEHPLDMPDWFVGDQCIARSPGRWLIRGRDSLRGTALALKVTELPALLTAQQSKQILDACEVAAKVRHPSWVAPSVAAVQQRHLGVIRPWLFARPWQASLVAQDVRTQLRNLATVAFTIEAAHGRGATHGGIHLENLMVDHEGKVQILDGGSSRAGLQRWLHPSGRPAGDGDHREQFASLRERKNIDTQDVIKLVAAASVEWGQAWAPALIAELRRISSDTPDEACGRIGQTMMRYADSQDSHVAPPGSVDQPPSWRRRLAHWLTRHE